jgi:hypothetical protein
MKRILITALFLGLLTAISPAQEILTGLTSNPALKGGREAVLLKQKSGNAIKLPFLDDFSYNDIYPASHLWDDRNAFVNRGYGVNPPTVGVVTLDALNDTGSVYTWAQPTPFLADYLTSGPVRLDSLFSPGQVLLTPADSVYLSFYYQAQGTGNNPNTEDSLMLEFFNPSDSSWSMVWQTAGTLLEPFKQVLIPIIDPVYFSPGFRFRFSNYASVATNNLPSWQSNVDQWNIDYVYLNAGRSKTDTVHADIAFVDPAPSILKDYRYMPLSQFSNSELKDTLRLKISNLNAILNNISYKYVVSEPVSSFSHTKNGGVFDILPFITNGYHNYPLHSKPAVDFTLGFPAGNDSLVYRIDHIIGLNGWSGLIPRNDTVTYYQEFSNYFAYDDGSAEAGYGLAGVNAKLAYRFKLNQPDTLSGVKMYFNHTLGNPYQKYFYLVVWSSLSPETVVYKSLRKRPEFGGGINGYQNYSFADDTLLVLNGTFYVGWQQLTDENLNVGFDRNSDASQHLFFNTEGDWNNTVYTGAPMIRPLLGTGWLPGKSSPRNENNSFTATVYPNPSASGEINIILPDAYNAPEIAGQILLEIFDYTGKLVWSSSYTPSLPTTDFNKGVYFLRLRHGGTGETFTSKLVLLR